MKVKEILIDEKKAIGVKLQNGQEITGKVIISNVDAFSTFIDLIGEDSLPGGFLSKLKGMKPSLSYFILYLGIEGEVDELSMSNNEVFFDDELSGSITRSTRIEFQTKHSFYLLVPSKVNPSHAPKGKSTLCLSYKVPYHLSADWGKEIRDQLSQASHFESISFHP